MGSGTQKFVYQRWPNQICPTVNFIFSHDAHFGLGGSSCACRGSNVSLPPPVPHTPKPTGAQPTPHPQVEDSLFKRRPCTYTRKTNRRTPSALMAHTPQRAPHGAGQPAPVPAAAVAADRAESGPRAWAVPLASG